MVSYPNPPPPGAFGCTYSSLSSVQHKNCLPCAPIIRSENPIILHFFMDSGCHCCIGIFLFFLLTLRFLRRRAVLLVRLLVYLLLGLLFLNERNLFLLYLHLPNHGFLLLFHQNGIVQYSLFVVFD